MKLYELALQHGITIGPGYMFSTTNGYSNFIRLNYSYPWSASIEEALKTVGKLVVDCMRQAERAVDARTRENYNMR
jgi:DNA-binding transcriptional MocR family regulator